MRPGDRVGDRFELERLAGSGGMGTVWRARDTTTGAIVAVKMLHTAEGRERFEREARVLAGLVHPGIVRYIEHATHDDDKPYLAMEWLEGEDLEHRLEKGRLALGESIGVAEAIAKALASAHARGVVHRDIKPSNIFLVDGDIGKPKLLDFGIAAGGAMETRQTRTGAILGTPGYMAPEQARGVRDVDARADVFSLGCVLFECLTGRAAFMGEQLMAILAKILLEDAPRVSELVTGVPEGLSALVASMLSKDRDERPSDGREVLHALSQLRSDTNAPPPRTLAPTSLGTGERRFASVIVLGRRIAADGDTIASDEAKRVPDAILDAARPFDAHLEALADGTIVAALFGGAPTDNAARAAACALAIRAVEPDAPLALVTGRGELKGHVPVGDAIDRAARLVRSSTFAIRIDDVTDALLDARFHRRNGEHGKELVGRTELDVARTLLGKATPCVGREAELAMLQAVASQCFGEPVSRAVLISGAPGIGKSRLRHELLQWVDARSDGVEVWIARGDPIGAHSAFGLASQLLRRTAGVVDGEPLAVRRDKLRARVGKHVSANDRDRIAAFFGEVIGTPFEDDDVQIRAARRDVMLMGDQVRRAWEDFVDAETKAHPVLVVLDDLHWGDLPTISLVDAALRLFSERPLLVLALARPEVDELFPALWKERDVQRLALAPLPRKASERLVRSTLGERGTPDVTARIVELAAGNAFHLEELIRSVSEGTTTTLPETVVAMVEARLEALEPETRRVLRAASVFGQVFWENGVAALVRDDPERRMRLDDLVKRELASRRHDARFVGETEYVFRHALVREAAYATLTESDRTLGHSLAGDWLESVGETDTMALAQHFERGGALLRAASAYTRAVAEALEGNDLSTAVARADRGIRCGATGAELGELLHLKAIAVWYRGEQADAVPIGMEAVRWLPHGSDRWGEAMGQLVTALGSQGMSEEVSACTKEMIAAVRSDPNAGCLDGAVRTAIAAFHAGLHDQAALLLESVGSAAEKSPNIATRGRLEQARAERAMFHGDTGSAAEFMKKALRLIREAGNVRAECLILSNVGFASLEIGLMAEASEALEVALARSIRLGLPSIEAAARQNLALALARRNHLADARSEAVRSAELFHALGNVRMEGLSRSYLAAILDDSGDAERAEDEARTALLLLGKAPPTRGYALAVLSRIVRKRAKLADALALAREAMATLDELGGVQEGEATVRLVLAEALDASGNRAEARDAIAVARDRLLARARMIENEGQRKSFLENVPDHAATMQLALRL